MKPDHWLEDLYQQHYAALYQLACNRLRMYVGHCSDAQDVLQDVFLLAAKKNICNHENPGGWLTLATVNLCKNYSRSISRRKETSLDQILAAPLPHSPLPPGSDLADTDSMDLMLMIQQTLSPDDYKLFCRYCLDGVELEDLAVELSMKTSTLRVRLYRIRTKLKKILNCM